MFDASVLPSKPGKRACQTIAAIRLSIHELVRHPFITPYSPVLAPTSKIVSCDHVKKHISSPWVNHYIVHHGFNLFSLHPGCIFSTFFHQKTILSGGPSASWSMWFWWASSPSASRARPSRSSRGTSSRSTRRGVGVPTGRSRLGLKTQRLQPQEMPWVGFIYQDQLWLIRETDMLTT